MYQHYKSIECSNIKKQKQQKKNKNTQIPISDILKMYLRANPNNSQSTHLISPEDYIKQSVVLQL